MIVILLCYLFSPWIKSFWEAPNLVGRVVEQDGNKILVISNISKDDITEDISKLLKNNYDATWVKLDLFNSLNRYDEGQKVHVWMDYLQTSYPGQTTAVRVQKVNE